MDRQRLNAYNYTHINTGRLQRVHLVDYNSVPTRSVYKIALQNHFSPHNFPSPGVTFEEEVFWDVCDNFCQPETRSHEANHFMNCLMEKKEATDREEQARITREKTKLQQGLDRLYTTRTPVESRPCKSPS